jgi:hypothetical protein
VKKNVVPVPGAALHPNLAALRLDDMLDDGEPEAGAALLARPRLVHPVEALENPRLGLRGQPRAVVTHADLDPAAGGGGTANPYPSATAGIVA